MEHQKLWIRWRRINVRDLLSLHALLSGEEAVVDLMRWHTTIIGNNLDKGIILAIESLKNEARKLRVTKWFTDRGQSAGEGLDIAEVDRSRLIMFLHVTKLLTESHRLRSRLQGKTGFKHHPSIIGGGCEEYKADNALGKRRLDRGEDRMILATQARCAGLSAVTWTPEAVTAGIDCGGHGSEPSM
jgi:hypothetical protein